MGRIRFVKEVGGRLELEFCWGGWTWDRSLEKLGRRDKGSMLVVDGRRVISGRREKDVGGERRGWFFRCVLCSGSWV